jgi:uncharacterized membrane protein
MEHRPIIELEKTQKDKVLNILSYSFLSLLWLTVVYNYTALPETIPTHFNIKGEADAYGSKFSLIILAVVGTVIFTILSYLVNKPHLYNYLTKITEYNAKAQYALASGMIRYLRFAVVLLFTIILILVLDQIKHPGSGLGSWLIIFVFCMIVIPVIYTIYKSSMIK